MHLMVVPLGADDVERRIAAIDAYASQLPGLFPSRLDSYRRVLGDRIPPLRPLLGRPSQAAALARVARAVREQVARTGGERLWHA
jgi:hypothetical protein